MATVINTGWLYQPERGKAVGCSHIIEEASHAATKHGRGPSFEGKTADRFGMFVLVLRAEARKVDLEVLHGPQDATAGAA